MNDAKKSIRKNSPNVNVHEVPNNSLYTTVIKKPIIPTAMKLCGSGAKLEC